MSLFQKILLIVGLPLALALLGLIRRQLRARRRKRLFATPLSTEQRGWLETHAPICQRMPPELRAQWEGLVQIFLAEKDLVGCGGLEVDGEMACAVAGQACLLTLNRGLKLYAGLRSVLLYPASFKAQRVQADGPIMVEKTDTLLGESWQGGAVVLSWESVRWGGRERKQGHNVVVHEFAHQLDQADGSGDGVPILFNRKRYVAWARIFQREYKALCKRVKRRRRDSIDAYGATNPAEFFAVATETFFETPLRMRREHAELYDELKTYYRVDPLDWHTT